jgi:hypothetical protein
MSETNLSSSRTNKAAMAAVIGFTIVALACIATFIVTVILVLDAIPFYHLFPH